LFHPQLKTMLKKHLTKAGFFGHGAIFLMVSPFTVNIPEAGLPQRITEQAAHAAAAPDTTDVKKDTVAVETPAALATTVAAPRIELNAPAAAYVKKFLPKNREELQATEKRSEKYFSIIEEVFAKYNLPAELKYLAVVESQLKTSALSHAGARGPWQLMAQTGRDFGLKVNGKVDERTHFYKSTVAAAKYLKALHKEFGDWLLVIAAYNGGSGTVLKAIKRSGSRNFWKLQGSLPAETRGHVKRFIGTHYYFQKDLSPTVLTKAELTAHLAEIQKWKEQCEISATESIIAGQ
jgi:membrane-bound lytic murein transglycosylase D